MTALDRPSTELVAVLVALTGEQPLVLTVPSADDPALPSGPLRASHRSLQAGLRDWVETQTGHALGYVEQLYTFADSDRAHAQGRVISVSYLGLTRVGDTGPSVAAARSDADGGPGHRTGQPDPATQAGWRGWYDFFPWEDHRSAAGRSAHAGLTERLMHWAGQDDPVGHDDPAGHRGVSAPNRPGPASRRLRCAVSFGLDGHPWVPDLCLHRYELLYEAGLIPESPRARWPLVDGIRMRHDHRRILATALARLRAKIQYRPVVFELMPPSFTLGQLQSAMEALAGTRVHKQNFRRLVEQQDLVEDTGQRTTGTGGRPAKLVRFRREVQLERQLAGTKLPIPRSR